MSTLNTTTNRFLPSQYKVGRKTIGGVLLPADEVVAAELQLIVDGYEPSNPHMLFTSRIGGPGKSALAHAIAHQRDEDGDYIYDLHAFKGRDAKASTLEELAVIRSTASFVRRFFIFEEVDKATSDFKEGLKTELDNASPDDIYVFTSNKGSELKKNYQPVFGSRVKIYDFSKPNEEHFLTILVKCLVDAGIPFNLTDVEKVMDKFYPDMRASMDELAVVYAPISSSNPKGTKMVRKKGTSKVLQKGKELSLAEKRKRLREGSWSSAWDEDE